MTGESIIDSAVTDESDDAKCGNDDADIDIGQVEQAYIGDVGANPNPLTFWWYAGDPTILRPAIECALERIRLATCLPIDVSLDSAHWVRQRPPEDMTGSGHTSGAWSSTRISLSTSLTTSQQCPVLVHEMLHTLRRSNSHPGADGSMTYPVTHVNSQPVSHLTAADLALICSVQACGCQNPEPPL